MNPWAIATLVLFGIMLSVVIAAFLYADASGSVNGTSKPDRSSPCSVCLTETQA